MRSYEFIKDFSKNSLIKYHLMHHLAGTPTFMYQKECFVALNGFDNVSMGQEYYLMLKTIKEGYNIGYLPEAEVIAYRHNMGGISQGSNKINGEINLYLSKKQYFDNFNRRELRFIKFRHNTVLAIAYMRNKNYLKMIQKIILICTVYLDLCITEIIKYVKKFKFVKIDI